MRHKGRKMLAALVAVLALGVVASASASAALPEFVPGTGEKLPIAVEGSSTAEASLANASGAQWVTCRDTKFKGEITGAKAASLTTELSECWQTERTRTCHTAGLTGGHVTFPGAASLVYITKATKKVGLMIKMTETTVTCGAGSFKLWRKLLVPLTPINSSTRILSLLIKGQDGKQEFTKYENEAGKVEEANLEVRETQENVSLDGLGEVSLATNKPVTVDA